MEEVLKLINKYFSIVENVGYLNYKSVINILTIIAISDIYEYYDDNDKEFLKTLIP